MHKSYRARSVNNMVEKIMNSSAFKCMSISGKVKQRLAFTLAEVLIALMIIGIISAIVIPGLMNSKSNQEFHTSAKKIFAELSNITNLLIQEKGGYFNWTNIAEMTNAYAAHMNFAELIPSASSSGPKLNSYPSDLPIVNYKTNTSPSGAKENIFGGLGSTGLGLLSNGTYIEINNYTCNSNYFGVLSCGWFIVDVNGAKPPNMWGRDVYLFFVTQKNGGYALIPAGSPETSNNDLLADKNGCKNQGQSYTGWGCAYYVIYDKPMP